MNKNCRLPRLNTLQLIMANTTLPVGQNTWPFDQGFFYQKIRFYQQPTDYVQKLLPTDTVTIYLDSLARSINISVIDNDGNVIVAVASGLVYTDSLAGNDDGYFGDQYFTFIQQFAPAGLSLADGFYWVVIEELYASSGDLANRYIVSECFQVRSAGWEKTMQFQYQNDINDYDVFFEFASTPKPWSFRVEAAFDEVDPASHDLSFENMFYQVEKLQSVPYRVFSLTIGGEGGVPDWVLDKVNRILACSNFTIDGIQYVKETNASWSKKNAANFPMKAATILLREANHDAGWEFPNSDDPSTFKIHDEVEDDVED